MTGWVSVALAALALGAPPPGVGGGVPKVPPSGVCELRGADRATTSSFHCMACHDGGAGPMIDFQMGEGAEGMSHPVEADYAAAAARHPQEYVPIGALPREVPLVAGKVTCTSCHDGASSDPKHVATPRRLCESCHRL